MRQALLIVMTAAAGLSACAPVPGGAYGYSGYSSGYYDQGYAPAPYYAEPYVTPGATIIVGGGRRWDDRDRERERYRFERQRNEGGYRGNPPNRDFGRSQPPPNFGGNRPGPTPAAAARPGPPPQGAPPPPPGRFERWNRNHSGPNDSGPR